MHFQLEFYNGRWCSGSFTIRSADSSHAIRSILQIPWTSAYSVCKAMLWVVVGITNDEEMYEKSL